jgi:hypothetical protein
MAHYWNVATTSRVNTMKGGNSDATYQERVKENLARLEGIHPG